MNLTISKTEFYNTLQLVSRAISPNVPLSLCRYIVVLFPINGLFDYIVILITLKVEY